MEELTIERLIGKDNITITLTEDELEKAYRIKEKRYLDEDFANALADAAQDPDTRFHTGHLEEFPELTDWLCVCFEDIYDANISHNDLVELTLNHLRHASLMPEFFISLAESAPAVCMGTKKMQGSANKTADSITAAAILPRQMTGAGGGKRWLPCSPCTGAGAAPVTKTELNVLPQNIWQAYGTSVSFSTQRTERRRHKMSNICMDTVVFFAASDAQKDGFSRLKKAVADCYPPQITVDDARLCRIFEQNGIPMDGLCLRSDITDVSLEDDHITLYCDSAWNPMYEAYLSLSSHFGVCFELEAEESGCGIYINTDINGAYLTTQYKAYLSERPEDGSLDMLFDNSHGDTDFYFDSEGDMLQWFRERGGIAADSAQELKDILDSDYVSIHEYVNPY